MYEIVPIQHYASENSGQIGKLVHREQQQQRAHEIIETCCNMVPAVLSQLQRLYPGTKFTCSNAKPELQEAFENGQIRAVYSWHLNQDMIVLRVVLKIESRNDSLSGSLKCHFGLWQAECDIDADKLAATLTELIASHGGWAPAAHHVPVHPHAG